MISIAIIGGTGKEGRGLAHRWASAGCRVILGSRSAEKGIAAAQEMNAERKYQFAISGELSAEAVKKSCAAVLTVPYSAHHETLAALKDCLAGKLLIDVTVPVVPPRVSTVTIPAGGSVALEAKAILGESVRVATAFQNVSFEALLTDESVDCDVLVCGDSRKTREEAIKLVNMAGFRGFDAGSLQNSIVSEGLTSVLIGINRQYGIHTAGIRITGVPD